MLGTQQQAPRRIAPLPVNGTGPAKPHQAGGGAGPWATGAAVPGQALPTAQHSLTRRMHVNLSVCSVVSYSKEKRKLQESHPPGCDPQSDSDTSSSDSEDSSSDAGSEDSDQKGSSGSEMEEASCASDVAVTSGGEGGVRGSGGRSSDKGGHKPRRRRAKRQKLVTYEADFVDDTEVLEARAATKEPKYGSTSNGFYVNQGRIETLEDEAEAKEAAAKGKGRGPRASKAPGAAKDKDVRHGAASADELPVRKRGGAADQAKSSADEHPLGNKKRNRDAEQSKPAPAPKKAKKTVEPPGAEAPSALPRAPAPAPALPPASPPAAPPAAPAASRSLDVVAFPPMMSLAQRAALAGKLASSSGPPAPKSNATPAAAPTSTGQAREQQQQQQQQQSPAPGAGPKQSVALSVSPAAASASPAAPSPSAAAAAAARPPAAGATPAAQPALTLAERKAAAAEKIKKQQQQQQQQAEKAQASPAASQRAPPAEAVPGQTGPSGNGGSNAAHPQTTPPPHHKGPHARFKSTENLLKSITNKLRDLTKAGGAQEAPTVSAMKQALKQSLSSLAMALHREGNPPEDHAAVVHALVHEGGALWPNPEAVAAELKTLQDRQLGSLASLRDALREQLASGKGIVRTPAGADGAPGQQDLAPHALGIWEKLLPLQRKLHGVASEGALLEEVASWGAAQSLQASTLEQALERHKKQKPSGPQAEASADTGAKDSKPSGKGKRAKGATVAAAAALANGSSNPDPGCAGPSSHSPPAAQPDTTSTDLAAPASHPAASNAPHTLGGEAALPPYQEHQQQGSSAPTPATTAAAGAAGTAPRSTTQQPAGPPTAQPTCSNAPQGAGMAAEALPGAASGRPPSPQASPRAADKHIGEQEGKVARGEAMGGQKVPAAASVSTRARSGGDAVEGRVDASRDGEVATAAAAAAAAAADDSSGAEAEGEATSGPADDETAPAAANGAANGAGDKGPTSGNTVARLPNAAEEATMLEAALAQASSMGANTDLLRTQYKSQVSIYFKAVLKALCYAGTEGFNTKVIRIHIQQYGYLVNWKGDTSSITQAIKAKKMSPVLAHIGGYRYALRAFPGVDELEQEKPVRADRQGQAQSHGKPSGGQQAHT